MSISLQTLLGPQPDDAIREAAARWCADSQNGGPPELPEDRAELLELCARSMEQAERVEARVEELPSKLADLLDRFLAEPGQARTVQALFEEHGQSFKSRFDVEASIAALHREGFLFPASDRRWASYGEACWAVPGELAECIAALRRSRERAIRETFTLKGFLEARHFRDRNGDPEADAEKAADHARKIYKIYLMESSIRSRVKQLPDAVRKVFLHALTNHGGLMATDVLQKELDDDEQPDLDLVRKCLEEGLLGTVAPLPLTRFGIQPVESAIVVFHEIVLIGLQIWSDRHGVEVDAALSSGVDLISNASRFLRELGSSKVQFTVDGQLYKASQKRIAKTLLDLHGGYMPAESQIGFLYRFFLSRRLIDRSGERALRPTGEGLDFDRKELQDKLRELLSYCVEERGLPGEHYHQVHLRRILLRLLKRTEPEQWHEVLFLPFLARNAWLCKLEEKNADGFFAGRFKGGGYVPTENLQQICWNLTLFIKQRLYPLGIVDLGLKDGRQVAVRLSRLGAELLQAEPAGRAGGARSTVVVNPDFEVILFPGDDEHEVVHTLDRFARRSKSDYLHHFKLEKDTVQAGLRDGMPFGQILQELHDRSRAPLPQNVLYSLEDWADQAGLVSLEGGRVLRARKKDVLDRFLALPQVEPHVERRLSDTKARLRENAPVKDLPEAVKDQGFVLELPG